jgi:hypothetical protein
MNEEENLTEIADQLKRLRPAQAGLDANVLFYQAGFAAGESKSVSSGWSRVVPLMAAGLLAAIVTAPASYRVGRTAAIRTESEPDVGVFVVDTTSIELPPEEESPSVEASPEIDDPSRASSPQMLARWIDPYGALAKSVKLDQELETTLAVYHSSLVSRQGGAQNWIDFPFSATLLKQHDWGSVDSADSSSSISPLAVSDLSQLAQSLEVSR